MVVAGLAACGSAPAAPDGYVRHETRGVSFAHPQGWTVQAEGDFGVIVRPSDLAEGAQSPSVAVAVDPGGSGNFAGYVRAVDTQLGTSGWVTGRFERAVLTGAQVAWVIESIGTEEDDLTVKVRRTDLIALSEDNALVHVTVRERTGLDDEDLTAVVIDSVHARR